MVLLWRAAVPVPLINHPPLPTPSSACFVSFTLELTDRLRRFVIISHVSCLWTLNAKGASSRFLPVEGGDVVKIAQLANITGSQNRISQPETPVTLQFQGNKFTLSPSQLRQLTTGQPLQLQGTLGNVPSHCHISSFTFVFSFISVMKLNTFLLSHDMYPGGTIPF